MPFNEAGGGGVHSGGGPPSLAAKRHAASVDLVEAGLQESLLSNRRAVACRNKIRETIAELSLGKNVTLDLAIGDPTKHGPPFAPPKFLVDALVESTLSYSHNGYGPAVGTDAARNAVAQYVGHGITKDDVIMGCGCSQAIDLTLKSLAGIGDTVLIPSPGFPLYETILNLCGITVYQYKLDPTRGWEVDLDDLADAALKCTNVRVVIVNNPGNPTGCVYSVEHLERICDVVHSSFPGAVILVRVLHSCLLLLVQATKKRR